MLWQGASPDGSVTVVTGPDQRFYFYPLKGGEPTPIPALVAGDVPFSFSADGRSLLVRRRGEVPARIMLLDIGSGKKDLWKELMPPDPAGVITISPVYVTPDWKSYAYSYQRSLADLYVVEGLK
jgi:hypothetical protein